jgi:hypothetical protein
VATALDLEEGLAFLYRKTMMDEFEISSEVGKGTCVG